MEFKTGDLIEVLADDPTRQYWYGELTDVNPVTVNYISPYRGDVWRFDENAYQVDKESINFVVDMSNKSKANGWRELGYVYRGEHEIIHADDVNSEEDDEDWAPSAEGEEEDEEDSDEADSSDDTMVGESEPEDIIDSKDDGDSEEEEDESEEVPQKKQKSSSTKKG